MTDGPFTDDMVRHYVKVVQTQHGILEAVEAMSKVLVEMGRASHKAVGDSPVVAIYKWTDLMRKRACQLLHEPEEMQTCKLPREQKKLPSTGT